MVTTDPRMMSIDFDSEEVVESYSDADVRFHVWAAPVLEAMRDGATRASEILRMKPGRIGPSKLRHCIAWLESRGLALYTTTHGWRPTDFGLHALEKRTGIALILDL